MTDESAFSDSEWHALTDAPLLVTAAIFFVGEHGPISMMKEASASAASGASFLRVERMGFVRRLSCSACLLAKPPVRFTAARMK